MATVEVILKEKIDNLGSEADVVSVRSGYARNYLIPKGKAYEANAANKAFIESLKAQRAAREAQELADAEKTATKIKKLKLRLELATGQGGKAFGSITAKDIAEAVKEQGKIDIDRHALTLDRPIKSTGRFDIPVKLHPDVAVDIRLTVDAKSDDESARSADE